MASENNIVPAVPGEILPSEKRYPLAVLHDALRDFKVVWDMVAGTVISLTTLGLQVWRHLIPINDWQAHKLWWILSFSVPYVLVLGAHAMWNILIAAPHNLYKKQKQEFQNKKQEWEIAVKQKDTEISALAKQLQIVLNNLQQPDVTLLWDWPEDQKRIKTLAGNIDKSIMVHNRSREYIYNIQIEPIKLRQELSFDTINEIAPSQQHLALGRWNGKSSMDTNYIYFFAQNEKEALDNGWVYKKTHTRDLTDSFLKVPMVIRYESNGSKWEREFEFIYDAGDKSLFSTKSGKRI